MKAKIYLNLIVFLVLNFTNIYAQEKSKKQLKEEKKIEQQKHIEALISEKAFVFNAKTVYPQSGSAIQLTTEYNVVFKSDFIKSDLPFFGRGFSGGGYGGGNGMTFEGKPEKFNVEKTKKSYIIEVEVKTKNDTFSMLLTVFFEGTASLSINSSNRSTISYNGSLFEIKKNNSNN